MRRCGGQKPRLAPIPAACYAFAMLRSVLLRRFHTAGLALLALGWAAAATGKTTLTVYTAIDPDETMRIGYAFGADNPEIELSWVRDSTDRITARLMKELGQPQADIVWGLAATSLGRLAAEGYFEPYAPAGFDKLDRRLSDPVTPPLWVGQRAWASALCVNLDLLKEAGLQPPVRWGDLLDPALRGRIVAPDPGATRTGYMAMAGWIALWREAGAWNYMENLDRNVAVYTRSGNAPCTLVARGQYLMGLSYGHVAAKLWADDRPVGIVLPEEGIGWDVEGMAIVRDTPRRAAARAFADWTVGRRAMEIQARGFAIPALPGAERRGKAYPANLRERLLRIDFQRAGVDRLRLVDDWRARFGAKAEPGN